MHVEDTNHTEQSENNNKRSRSLVAMGQRQNTHSNDAPRMHFPQRSQYLEHDTM